MRHPPRRRSSVASAPGPPLRSADLGQRSWRRIALATLVACVCLLALGSGIREQRTARVISAAPDASDSARRANHTAINATLGGPSGDDALSSALEPEAPPSSPALWYFAPFLSSSSFASEAFSVLTALTDSGALDERDLWLSHAGDEVTSGALDALRPAAKALLERRDYAAVLQRHPAQVDGRRAIAVCHVFFDCWAAGSSIRGDTPMSQPGCPCPPDSPHVAYRIGRAMFEAESLPRHLVRHCNAMDEVWVPTEFNRASFATAGVQLDKLRVVPEAIDTVAWDPALLAPPPLGALASEPALGLGDWPPGASANSTAPFVFLSVFKWEARKGWKGLLQAYFEAFKPTDPVLLLILAKPFMGSGTRFVHHIQRYAASALNVSDFTLSPRVRVSYTHLSERDYMATYRLADALVIPTRGEGWGRPLMEAAAMALPVITTNWSGPTAFLNDDVAYLIPVERLVVAGPDDSGPFFAYFQGQRWAQPNITHLVHLLRHVYTHREEAGRKGAAARAHIAKNFSHAQLSAAVAAELERVRGVIASRQQ